MGRLADQSTGCFDNPRHAGHASNQHQFVDLLGRNAGVAQTGLSRGDRALEEGVTQLLHLGAGKLQGDVLRTGSIGRDEGQVDLVLLGRGQCDLGLFGLFLNALERIGLLAEINSLVFLEFGQDPVDDGVIPVVAAQVGIAVGGLHFEDTVADFQDGDIERAAAQVVHGDLFVFLFVETVSQRSCGGFVDNPEDFQARNLTGIFGGLTLSVVKIGRHRDHGLGDGLAQANFGIGLQLGQDHCADLWGAERLGLALDFDLNVGITVGSANDLVGHSLELFLNLVELTSNESFDRVDGVPGVGHGLTLGRFTH